MSMHLRSPRGRPQEPRPDLRYEDGRLTLALGGPASRTEEMRRSYMRTTAPQLAAVVKMLIVARTTYPGCISTIAVELWGAAG